MPRANLVPVVTVDDEAVPRSNGTLASKVLGYLPPGLQAHGLQVVG